MTRRQDRYKRRFKLLNQFHPVTTIARTTPGTHNPRISAHSVTNRLRETGERHLYTMYILYAAFLFWPSIWSFETIHCLNIIMQRQKRHDVTNYVRVNFLICGFVVCMKNMLFHAYILFYNP